MQPGGRFTATNVPLRQLITLAYQVQAFQIEGGPTWLTSDKFNIVAKADRDFPPQQPGGPPGPLQQMMQALLEERFKLAVHRETKERAVYALIMARNDGKLGPQLRQSTTDCAAFVGARGRGGPPTPLQPGERPQCGMRMGRGELSAGSVPLSQIATVFSGFLRRVVLDRTGLTGSFDVDLTCTPDQIPQGPPPPGAPELPPIDPNGPSIFTAVQEQLGLKLDAERGPVDVLVVDTVEPPTPD